MSCEHASRAGVRCTSCGARLAHRVAAAGPITLAGFDDAVVIGRGGGGVVARARDGGRSVIVKLAHPERGGWLDHEAGVLEALGPPLVPALHRRGRLGDQPYLVLQDLGDDALAGCFAAGPPGERWQLAAALLDAVAGLHARGYRHGDLKPENAMRAGESVVLIDLGSAARAGEPAPVSAASIDYAAPEVLAGERAIDPTGASPPPHRRSRQGPTPSDLASSIDLRADVYSLGVMLYELASGRVPFAGTAEDVRRAHAQRPPPPLDPQVAAPPVAAVIARCLAKLPGERFADAGAVAAALRSALAAPPSAPVPPAVSPPVSMPAFSPPSPAREVPPPGELGPAPVVAQVGRDRQVALLSGSIEQATSLAMPTLATVLAEPGMGKTRLHDTMLAALTSDPRGDVMRIAAESSDGSLVDDTLRQLVLQLFALPAVGELRADHLAALAGAEVASELWPPLALTLGLDGGEVRTAAAPRALRHAVARGIAACLRARAGRRPLRVLVDDAHLADDATLEACELAVAPGADVPLWIGAFARPELIQQRPGWGERAERHDRIQLPPLGPDAAADLVRRLLEPVVDVPAVIVAALVDIGQGVPLRLAELIGELRRSGGVRRHRGTGGWYVAADDVDRVTTVPSISAVVARDLAAMGDSLAWFARLGAILGTVFEVATAVEVATATGAAPLDPGVALHQLRRRGVLLDTGGRLRFRHALVREAVREATEPLLARQLHVAAYGVLAARGGADERSALALHASRGGLAIAGTLHHELAIAARRRHAYIAAERHAGEVIGFASATLEQRVDALRIRADARHRMGRYDDAFADLAAATAAAGPLDDGALQAELALDRAIILDWSQQYALAAAAVEEAAARCADPSPPLAARLRVARGRTAWRAGDRERAAADLAAGVALADATGDVGYESRVVGRLMLGAILAVDPAELGGAAATFAQAIELCERHGDQMHLAAALNNRRHVWIAQGEVDRVLADAAAIVAISRDLGVPALEYGAAYNAGEMLWRAGRLAEARPYIETAVRLEARHRSGWGARLLEIRLLIDEGRGPDARSRRDGSTLTSPRIGTRSLEASRSSSTELDRRLV